jgi:hypothetical protein
LWLKDQILHHKIRRLFGYHRLCVTVAPLLRDHRHRRTPWALVEDSIMKIDSTQFGSITVDGETYAHDVVVRLSGKVEKRKKKLSKKIFGTSHVMSLPEAEFVYEKGSDLLVLGTGQ